MNEPTDRRVSDRRGDPDRRREVALGIADPADHKVFHLLDASATAAVAVDGHGTIRYVNARAAEVFGYEIDELLGQPIDVLVPRGRAAAHVAQRDHYLSAPTPRPLNEQRDIKGRRKDGTEFAAEISLAPLETETGLWVVASVLDVSLRKEAEARVRRQSRSYLALARFNEAAAKAESEAELFRKVCNIAVVNGGFIGAWVLAEGAASSLQMKASAGPLATRLAVESAASGSIDNYLTEMLRSIRSAGLKEPGAMEVLTTGEPSFTEDFRADGRGFASQDHSEWIRCSASLPLRRQGLTVASLTVFSDRPGAFEDGLRPLLVSAAENISRALDRFQAQGDLDRALAQRTDLLRRLVDAQERERARIAADVHDEPLQALAAADLRLGMLQRQLADVAPQLIPDVIRIHETVSSVSEELRDLLFELEPVGPTAHLTHLLEEAAAHIFELTDVRWEMENEPDARELDLSVTSRTQAVRIAKEAMANVAKHAQATTALIAVHVDDDGVTVRVVDDGIGIPPGVRSSPPGHRGISGMLDRAAVAGGSISVESAAVGTTISVWLPRE